MQLSDLTVKLSPDGWHRKLQVYTFGPNTPRFPDLCRFFWLTMACVPLGALKYTVLFPFRLVWFLANNLIKKPVEALTDLGIKGYEVGNPLVIKGAKWFLNVPVTWLYEAGGDRLASFIDGIAWLGKAIGRGVKGGFKLLGAAIVWSFEFSEKVTISIAIGIGWCLLKFWGHPYSPMRPVRWFMKRTFVDFVLNIDDNTLFRYMDRLSDSCEGWLSNFYWETGVSGKESRSLYNLSPQQWEDLDERFYLMIDERFPGRKRYSRQARKMTHEWQTLSSWRLVNDDWETRQARLKEVREAWQARQAEQRKLWQERGKATLNNFTKLATLTQSICMPIYWLSIRAIAVIAGVSLCYLGYEASFWIADVAVVAWGGICWFFGTCIPDLWTSFWGGVSNFWNWSGDVIRISLGIVAALVALGASFVALLRYKFFDWLFEAVLTYAVKPLEFVTTTLLFDPVDHAAKYWVGPSVKHVATKWVVPAAEAVWAGLSFFLAYAKAVKENHCPAIDWQEEDVKDDQSMFEEGQLR